MGAEANSVGCMKRALVSVLAVISALGILRSSRTKTSQLFRQIYANFWQEFGAISSVVERLLHTQEVAGSNPASRMISLRPRNCPSLS